MKRECQQCSRSFRTDSGLAWHRSHIHGQVGSSFELSDPGQMGSSAFEEIIDLVEQLDSRVSDQEGQIRGQLAELEQARNAITSLEVSLAKESYQRKSLFREVEKLNAMILLTQQTIEELIAKAKEEKERFFPFLFFR